MMKWIFSIVVLASATVGCGGAGSASSESKTLGSEGGLGGGLEPETPPDQNNPGVPSSPANPINMKFCSDLDLSNLIWSSSLPVLQRAPLALALNLSGSFEGPDGWSNLTGNFDGQGISMGLLNQPLGTGSLQPMWAEMRNINPTLMKTILTAAHFDSVTKMLKDWGATLKTASVLDIEDYGYNDLDDPDLVAAEIGVDPSELKTVSIMSASTNSKAVTWAKQNVLKSNGDLKSDWDKQLRQLAATAEYRSIQVSKAEAVHRKALEYFKYFGASELRSYLFFFDIAVQNGSISATVKTKYAAWLKTNKTADEKTRMLKILEYRLKTVRAAYVNDVKARKTSILNGKGTVHGESRNYEKEYCSNLALKLK